VPREGRRRTRSRPADDAAVRSEDRGGSPLKERSLAWRLLVAVGLGYLIVQAALIPFTRPPGWDESIYLSQVTPGIHPMIFFASRARGITLLVAPVTWLGGSVTDVRLFLMVASAIATTVTFRLWIPLVGLAAPVAAVLFSFTWLGLLNGSEVMPNLWAAILALATAGLVARRLEGGTRGHAALAAATLGALGLVRPTEAAVAAGAIGLFVLVYRRTEWRLLSWVVLGLLLGWIPWFVEMSVRFGGPVSALRAAAAEHVARAPVGHNVLVHLAATGGEFTATRVPLGGAIWWGLLVLLAVVAIARAAGPTDRAVAIFACIGTLAFAAEYLIFVSALAPRFLLPAYAFASLPAAIGLVSLLRGGLATRVAGSIVLLFVIPWAIWQGRVADEVESQRARSTSAFHVIGLKIRQLADGRPCAFMSPHGFPTIAFASGCDGAELPRPAKPSAVGLDELRVDGRSTFVILKRTAPPTSPLGSLTSVRVAGPGKAWFIYQIPDRT
jgi:hypothetical protein